ncbi:HEAT repeat domain-containing protein [Actinomadura sp. HBU206391]|uniref:HEAT repeat domain-containing protein n=1 Tax=Actinomadura sp. HBU206391 TaxID=2731692 RepID=UPI00164FF8FE|nr:HEAT repeat domain-containing protein [Actinomadura sp. HBU206391]MBC6456676.1 HEAT repeat domain-containing protein [Actinomadura sp. HBU206391]
MIDGDVLEGLDAVRWAELRHAYGFAEDVPGLLRALRSDSSDERERALGELYGNIFHQGNRYEAAAYAVPFLARLALDPATPERAEVVYLLAALAIGYDESHLPAGVDVTGWRAQLERVRSMEPEDQRRELDRWMVPDVDEEERRDRIARWAMYDPAEVLRSMHAQLDVYDAVRAEVPELRGLVAHGAPEIRAAAVYLLAWFPEEAAASTVALRELLQGETVTGITAGAIVSAALLSDQELVPRLREHLAGSEPLLRWAAAVALARLDVLDSAVIEALAAASADPPEPGPGPQVGFLQGDLRAYATQTLAALAGRVPQAAVDAVLTGLSRSSEVAAFAMAEAALRLTFPAGALSPLPPFEELTEPQRRVVRVLAELGPETWRWVNFTSIMRDWNLPAEQPECRAYAGLDAPN